MQALTDRFSAAAGRAAEGVRAHLLATTSSNLAQTRSPEPPPTAAQRVSKASRIRRQARYDEAARLHAAGVTVSRIAAELGAERKTVRRWLRLGQAPLWKHPAAKACCAPSSDTCNSAGVRAAAMALSCGANFANAASGAGHRLCGAGPASGVGIPKPLDLSISPLSGRSQKDFGWRVC